MLQEWVQEQVRQEFEGDNYFCISSLEKIDLMLIIFELIFYQLIILEFLFALDIWLHRPIYILLLRSCF